MSLFPTKFVADVGILQMASNDTVNASLTVNGTVVLSEKYSPANGQITIRGLRNVLEAAIYGELGSAQNHAAAIVQLTVGSQSFTPPGGYLFASRLKNPRDPNGSNSIMAAGDLVAVSGPNGFITPATYTYISGTTVLVQALSSGTDGQTLVNGLKLWIDHTACPEKAEEEFSFRLSELKRFLTEAEYASWSDLITSRKAEVLMNGQWLPILITKANYTQVKRSMGMNRVEISFKMADPRQGL